MIKKLKLTNYGLDLCFDIYESPSVKFIKRKPRGDRDLENIYNLDSQQSLTTDFVELLITPDIKTRVFAFPFLKIWGSNLWTIGRRKLVVLFN